MDYVAPKQLLADMLKAAQKKAALRVRDLMIRGMLTGVLLRYATSLVMVVLAQGLPAIVGAILFPTGFVMLVLLGLELATGNFVLLPAGLLSRDVRFRELVRNWGWVYFGNLVGSIAYALFFISRSQIS
jgi:formate/nitrite transporter FocA (FNT family)